MASEHYEVVKAGSRLGGRRLEVTGQHLPKTELGWTSALDDQFQALIRAQVIRPVRNRGRVAPGNSSGQYPELVEVAQAAGAVPVEESAQLARPLAERAVKATEAKSNERGKD